MRKSPAYLISMSIFVLLAVLPLVAGLVYAGLYSLGLVGLQGKGPSLEAWQTVLGSSRWWSSLGASIYIALASIGSAALLALGILSNKQGRGKNPEAGFWIYLPLTMPAMVVGLWIFQALSPAGLFSRLAFASGWINSLQEFPRLVQDKASLGIILAHVFMATPFLTILFIQMYHRENLGELSSLARSLGASEGQIRWRVRLPILIRKAAPTLLLYFIFVLGSYEIPLILGRSAPQMVSVHIIDQLQGFDLATKPQAYAMALMYAFLVLGMVILLFRKPKSTP